jgi:hypothetical protein
MVEEETKSCRRCAMGKKRFQKTGMGLFWGEYLSTNGWCPKTTFCATWRVIDWEVFGAQLLAL